MKNIRQEKLLEIIEKKSIYNQEELQKALLDEGINTTQPTISRDIKELGIVKIRDGGDYKYGSPKKSVNSSNYLSYFTEAVLSIDIAMNIVVIKCKNGMAQATCASLDSLNLHNIVGTLAGDDTIFIATKDEDTAKNLLSEISGYLI